MKIAWKKIVVAGVLGFTGGQAAAKFREHPDSLLPILQVSAASGVVGAVVGWNMATYRKVPPHIHSLSLAANCAVVSGTFLGIRRAIQASLTETTSTTPSTPSLTTRWSPSTTHYVSSIASGGVTGTLISLISRFGLRSILLTSLGGMGIGLCAQAGYNRLMVWRKKKAIQLYYKDLGREEEGKGRFTNWTFKNFEARFLQFWHQESEGVGVEMEILRLERAVAEERQKIAELDKQFRENGVTLAQLSEFESSNSDFSTSEVGIKPSTVSL